MATGLNQNVDILGRTFHVQTEISSGDSPTLRTTIFVGGRIVGSREVPVRDTEDEALREQINRQHALVVDTLHQRAHALQKGKELMLADGATPSPRTVSTRSRAPAPCPLPQVREGSRLALAIRVRQLVGPFSQSFRTTPPSESTELASGLEAAAEGIDQIMASPSFPDIRLDEQVHFFGFRERLASWRAQHRDPACGREIWTEIAVYCSHLRSISARSELRTYDLELLSWALAQLHANGLGEELMTELYPLFGRDPALDQLLEDPVDTDAAQLAKLLTELHQSSIPEED